MSTDDSEGSSGPDPQKAARRRRIHRRAQRRRFWKRWQPIASTLGPVFTALAAGAACASSCAALQNLNEVQRGREPILALESGTDALGANLTKTGLHHDVTGPGGVQQNQWQLLLSNEGVGTASNIVVTFLWPPGEAALTVPGRYADRIQLITPKDDPNPNLRWMYSDGSVIGAGPGHWWTPVSWTATLRRGVLGNGKSMTIPCPPEVEDAIAIFALTDADQFERSMPRMANYPIDPPARAPQPRRVLRVTVEYDTPEHHHMRQEFELTAEIGWASTRPQPGQTWELAASYGVAVSKFGYAEDITQPVWTRWLPAPRP